MAPRRQEALMELLAEIADGVRPPDRKEGTSGPAGEQDGALAGAGVIAMPVQSMNHEVGPPEAARSAQRRQAPISMARPSAKGPVPSHGGAAFERRAQSRHTVDTGATIFLIDLRGQISGRIVDLSLGGCRIRADERFPVGIYRRVETEFKLDGLPFRLGGVVQAVHDKFAVGIRFLDMSARKKEQLELLIHEIKRQGQGTSD
jgi:hypothetical protein